MLSHETCGGFALGWESFGFGKETEAEGAGGVYLKTKELKVDGRKKGRKRKKQKKRQSTHREGVPEAELALASGAVDVAAMEAAEPWSVERGGEAGRSSAATDLGDGCGVGCGASVDSETALGSTESAAATKDLDVVGECSGGDGAALSLSSVVASGDDALPLVSTTLSSILVLRVPQLGVGETA